MLLLLIPNLETGRPGSMGVGGPLPKSPKYAGSSALFPLSAIISDPKDINALHSTLTPSPHELSRLGRWIDPDSNEPVTEAHVNGFDQIRGER